ncbi:hypothetical protein QJQ45_024926, partial [Haematococcus lacustris]
ELQALEPSRPSGRSSSPAAGPSSSSNESPPADVGKGLADKRAISGLTQACRITQWWNDTINVSTPELLLLLLLLLLLHQELLLLLLLLHQELISSESVLGVALKGSKKCWLCKKEVLAVLDVRGSLRRYGLGPYVSPVWDSIEARNQSRNQPRCGPCACSFRATRKAVRASHEMEHDATNPPQYLDAEVDGSGRAEAVLSESKARSTQEAPRGCETEHPRPA